MPGRAIEHGRWIVVALALAAFLPFLGQTRDVAAREIRHAEIAREMAVSGDFVVPTLLGREYDDKPPVLYATVALLYRLDGGYSLALARLPSVAAAVFGAIAVYDLALLLGGSATALLAALGTLAMVGYQHMARTALPDMLQTAAILAACLAAGRAMRARRAAWRLTLFTLAGAMAGVALVTKGPLGIAVPVLFVGFASLLDRPRLSPPSLAECCAAGLGVCAATACWAVPAYLHDHGGYLRRVVQQRDLTWHPDDVTRPFYWYLSVLPQGLLPITLLVPWLARGVRRRGWSAALALSLAIFALLAIAPKKRTHYLLPLYPFAALAAAEAVVAAKNPRLRHAATALVATGLAAGPLYFAVPAVGPVKAEDAKLAAARQVLAALEPGRTVLCFNDLAEEIAFTNPAVAVQMFEDTAGLSQAVSASVEGSYVVVPDYARERVLADLDASPRLTEMFRVRPPSHERDWSVYRVERSRARRTLLELSGSLEPALSVYAAGRGARSSAGPSRPPRRESPESLP